MVCLGLFSDEHRSDGMLENRIGTPAAREMGTYNTHATCGKERVLEY